MSKIEEIRKRHQERQAGEEPADYSLAFEEAHEDRAALLAALDGEWQSERPAPGLWWVAIDPAKRSDLSFWSGTDPIKDVWVAKSGEVFQGNMSLSDEILTGALWQRRTVPRDPFKNEDKHE
jgi:hypothetical protein